MGDTLSKEEDLTALAKDLNLNGDPLQIPRMHPVEWKDGQIFTETDDTDRMNTSNYQWNPPKFISEKDPILQRQTLTVDEIDLQSIWIDVTPNSSWPYPSFAKVINNILEPEECAELISCINKKGKFILYSRIFRFYDKRITF